MKFNMNMLNKMAAGLMLAFATIAMIGCGFGEKIVVDGTEVYFDGVAVTEADAQVLGDYLAKIGFSDGNTKSVMLAKDGETWQLRMVVKESFQDNEEFLDAARIIINDMSQTLYEDATVQFEMCDDRFNTIKTFRSDAVSEVVKTEAEATVGDEI